MERESVGTSACAPKGACVCVCVRSHVCAMPWGPQRGTSVRVGACSFPDGAPDLSPGCPSLRGGGVLVLRGDVWEHLLRAGSSVFVFSHAAAQVVQPHTGRQLWDVGEESTPRCPNPTCPRPHHGPPAYFGPGLGSPQCSLCLPGTPPHSTKRLFPSLIERPFYLPETGKQNKPADVLEGVCVFSCGSVGINNQ